MEKALSLDNVFVIAVLLGTFAVPQALKADVLTFGIAVALMLRTVFIVAGVTLLELFHPAIYVMGALLIFTGIRLAINATPARTSPRAGRCARCGGRCRSARSTRGADLRARGRPPGRDAAAGRAARGRAGRRDLRDRLDPRRAGDHQDTFLIFAANAFALLGLRALYFLLDGMAQRFEYLHYGLGALLVFVGAKMLVEDIVGHRRRGLARRRLVLGAWSGASLLFSSKTPPERRVLQVRARGGGDPALEPWVRAGGGGSVHSTYRDEDRARRGRRRAAESASQR